MRLTVVGCSGSVPGPQSPASCYLLQAPYDGRVHSLLLDLGSGAFGPLQSLLTVPEIDGVALTHLHADHCLDMTALYVAARYGPDAPGRRIPVWAPPGAADRLARAYDLAVSPGMTGEFAFSDWSPREPVAIGPFTVTAVAVNHPVPTFALRVECGGRVLAYSGDTGPCAGLIEAATDADVLLAEASFVEGADNPPDLHLTGRQAAEHAASAATARLLLTHVPPWIDAATVLAEAADGFDGPVELVAPGASYDV